MSHQEVVSEPINEGTTGYLTATLKDHLGIVVPLASVSTLKLWLTSRDTGAVINTRNGVSILNTAGGTLGATDGAFTLKLGPLDNVIVDATQHIEWHLALIQYAYNGGADKGELEVAFPVKNLSVLP